MITKLKNKLQYCLFRHDESGNVAVTTAIMILPIMFVVGLTVDYSSLSREQGDLQELADGAALYAASQELVLTKTEQEFERDAKNNFVANYEYDPDKVEFDLDRETNSLTVTLEKDFELAFSKVMSDEDIEMDILAEATFVVGQREVEGPPFCLFTTGTSGTTLSVNGVSEVSATGCSIQINSDSSNAGYVAGVSNFDVAEVCVNGGFNSSFAVNTSAAVNQGCPPLNDPFVALEQPDVGNCDYSNLRFSGTTSVTTARDDFRGSSFVGFLGRPNTFGPKVRKQGSKIILSPGVYCNGVSFNGVFDVELDPGIYTFLDGKLSVTGVSSLNGDSVFLYFRGNDAGINFNGTPTINLSAPTVAEMNSYDPDLEHFAGFVIYYDPNYTYDDVSINGVSNGPNFDGIVYLANAGLTFNGVGTINGQSDTSVIIAESMQFNGVIDLEFQIDPDFIPPVLATVTYEDFIERVYLSK